MTFSGNPGNAPALNEGPIFSDARDMLDGATDPNRLDRPLYGATFGQAFVRLLLGFARFGGRASPSEFWWGSLVLLILRILPYLLLLLIFLIGTSLDSYDPVGPTLHIGSSVVALYAILLMLAVDYGLLLPQLSMTWRRLHDANLPGPLALLMLVPLFGQLAVLVMVLTPSNPAGRRFDSLNGVRYAAPASAEEPIAAP